MTDHLNISIENETNIFGAISKRAIAYPDDQVALSGDGGKGVTYTYKELCQAVHRLASGLRHYGLVARPEIGVLSENRPEYCLAYLAINAVGGTVVPIDANLKPNEISYIIEHAKIDVIFCSERFREIVSGFGRSLKMISLDPNVSDSFVAINDPDQPEPIIEDNEVAVLIYTSGTTGDPKAVELTHKNIICDVAAVEEVLEFTRDDIFLSVLPLHHTFEATCGFITPLLTGSKIVYARSLKSRDLIEDIGANNISVMCGVPLLYEKMYHGIVRKIESAPLARRALVSTLMSLSRLGWKAGRKWGRKLFFPLRKKAGLSSIRVFVSGGAALPPKIAAFFNYLGFDMIQGYGLTETSPVLTAHLLHDIRFGSVGPPLPGIEIKIKEPNALGIGEIIARGDVICRGYRDNPQKTDELIQDGWLHTGDLGKFQDGHLWITGRAKNVIISAAGKNIYPEEIEERLLESVMIMEVIVFGRSKEGRQGEEVRALIVPDIIGLNELGIKTDEPADMGKIRDLIGKIVTEVNSNMADYKRISVFDVQLDELEKTSTKKVKRFQYK